MTITPENWRGDSDDPDMEPPALHPELGWSAERYPGHLPPEDVGKYPEPGVEQAEPEEESNE